MAAERSYAKLGVFLVVALLVVLATGLFFIQRMRSRESIAVVTYTKQNVHGLDVGSPVRYNGVPIGRVTRLRVNPETAVIEIAFEIFADRVVALGVDIGTLRDVATKTTIERLRAQIESNPITDEAQLLLSRPDPLPTPMDLGFTPTLPYVPSVPTAFASLQDRLPQMVERIDQMTTTLNEVLKRTPDTLDRSNRFFMNVEQMLRESNLPQLSAETQKFLAASSSQLVQLEQLTAEITKANSGDTLVKFMEDTRASIETTRSAIESTHAAIDTTRAAIEETRVTFRDANLPATTQTMREAMERTGVAVDDLRRSLPVIRDSLERMRDLTTLLEEQPEAVVYGPRPPARKSK